MRTHCASSAQSEGQVAELEAAKDQMEQDLFNSQQALQTLQQSERKVGQLQAPSWSVLLVIFTLVSLSRVCLFPPSLM